MEIKFNIINISEILSQLGKDEESAILDKLIVGDTSWSTSNQYGFRRCIDRFLDNVSINDNVEEYRFMRTFINEKLQTEKFYDANTDSLDVLYCLENAKSQPIMMSMIDTSSISFDKKIMSDRFLYKLHDILGRVHFDDRNEARLFDLELYYRLANSNFTKVFDRNLDAKECSDDFEITYVPKGKATILSDSGNKWAKTNRINAKFVRAIKKLPFRYKYSNRFYEQLNNAVVAAYVTKVEFKVVSGDDIIKYYDESSYADEETASLGSSCMRYSHCSDYIRFYAVNEDVVKLVVAFNQEEKVVGRALLWNTNCGTAVMDRIYGTDIMVEKFKKYAIDNGYVHKENQSYSDNDSWVNGDGCFSEEYRVTVKNIRTMPYMDTFKYTDGIDSDTMIINNDSGCYEFTDTDGARETFEGDDDDYVYCERSGDRIHVDDAHYVSSRSEYYRDEYCVFAENSSEWELKEDCVYLEYKDIWVDEDADVTYIDSTESDMHGEYVYSDDAVLLRNDTYCYVDEAYFNDIDGEWWFKDGRNIVVKYFTNNDECTINVYSNWYSDEELVYAIKANTTDELIEIIKDGEVIYKMEEVINE
jgi:hypothetical protein